MSCIDWVPCWRAGKPGNRLLRITVGQHRGNAPVGLDQDVAPALQPHFLPLLTGAQLIQPGQCGLEIALPHFQVDCSKAQRRQRAQPRATFIQASQGSLRMAWAGRRERLRAFEIELGLRWVGELDRTREVLGGERMLSQFFADPGPRDQRVDVVGPRCKETVQLALGSLVPARGQQKLGAAQMHGIVARGHFFDPIVIGARRRPFLVLAVKLGSAEIQLGVAGIGFYPRAYAVDLPLQVAMRLHDRTAQADE